MLAAWVAYTDCSTEAEFLTRMEASYEAQVRISSFQRVEQSVYVNKNSASLLVAQLADLRNQPAPPPIGVQTDFEQDEEEQEEEDEEEEEEEEELLDDDEEYDQGDEVGVADGLEEGVYSEEEGGEEEKEEEEQQQGDGEAGAGRWGDEGMIMGSDEEYGSMSS